MTKGPPGILERLVRAGLGSDDRSAWVVGDLREEYARLRERASPLRANAWYGLQGIRLIGRVWFARGWDNVEGKRAMGRLGATGSVFAFARRRIRKAPGFSAVVVLTLALGIGANAAVFSLVNGVLLRPLPYEAPEDLVFLWSDLTSEGVPRAWVNGGHAYELQQSASSFSHMVPMELEESSLTRGDGADATDVVLGLVASNFFDALGVAPRLGRAFLVGEEGSGAPAVAVLTHELWQSVYGGDPAVVGASLRLDGDVYEVIGVMSPSFRFHIHQSLGDPTPPGLFVPLDYDLAGLGPEYGFWMAVMGRIAPDVPHERAFAELDAIASRLGERDWNAPDFRFDVGYLSEDLVAQARPLILLLMAAVAVVLAIVCANVATVYLARAVARQRDSAVQIAMGASRTRLAAATAAESLLLSMAGAALGLLLAYGAVSLLVGMAPVDLPRLDEVSVDVRVGLLTIAAAALVGLVTALAPSFLHRRAGTAAVLRGSGSRSGRSVGVGRTQRGLVGVQVAMSTALLISVGLIGKSMLRLFEVDAGFRHGDQVILTTQAGGEGATDDQVLEFYETLTDRLAGLPGVRRVGAVSALPLSTRANQHHLDLSSAPGATGDPDLDEPLVDRLVADDAYAEAAGLEIVEGRWFEAGEMVAGTRVAVIDRILAERFWPDGSPVGERLGFPGDTVGYRVVGVVRQPRLYDLGADDRPQWWLPHSADVRSRMSVVVDAGTAGAGLPNQIRQVVRELDPTVAVSDMSTMEGLVRDAVSRWRFALWIMGAFGTAALLLAVLGVYGVVSYAVERRTSELGIRMALGAQARSIRTMVVRQGIALVGWGLVLGTAGAWASGRFLSSLLYGVTPRDPAATAAVVAVLLLSAAAATYLPARRASRITPMEAFREE